jgi:hypothetical protein
MSYQGYTPLMVSYLEEVLDCRRTIAENPDKPVHILEIGVDRGQTSIILMSSLITRGIPFIWTGVDIRHDDNLAQQIVLMEGVDHYIFKDIVKTKSYAIYRTVNSLDFLASDKNKYDLVLIDGDHNYDTVSKELSYLDKITHDYSMVICDDYAGIHAGKDTFYSDNESHRNLEHASMHLSKDVNKGGVTAAVDEFIMNHDNWHGAADQPYEVCFLYRTLVFSYKLEGDVKVNVKNDTTILFHPENLVCSFNINDHRPSTEYLDKIS